MAKVLYLLDRAHSIWIGQKKKAAEAALNLA
jgi:hypothetical protein